MILFGPLILFKNENRHNAFLPCSCWGQVFPFWHSHLWGWVMGDVHFLLYTFIFKIFYNAHALFKNKSFKGLNKYQNHESYSSVRCKTDEVKSANKHGLLSIKVVSVQSSSGHRGWPWLGRGKCSMVVWSPHSSGENRPGRAGLPARQCPRAPRTAATPLTNTSVGHKRFAQFTTQLLDTRLEMQIFP